MIKNVQLDKKPSESNASLLRRFTKAVQGSGVLPRVRSLRYADRKQSHYKVKKARLVQLERKTKFAELVKLGKIAERGEQR